MRTICWRKSHGSESGTQSTSNEHGANKREADSTVTGARERDCAVVMSVEQGHDGFDTFLYDWSLERSQIKTDTEIAFATSKVWRGVSISDCRTRRSQS